MLASNCAAASYANGAQFDRQLQLVQGDGRICEYWGWLGSFMLLFVLIRVLQATRLKLDSLLSCSGRR
jgi:hypothetical protein